MEESACTADITDMHLEHCAQVVLTIDQLDGLACHTYQGLWAGKPLIDLPTVLLDVCRCLLACMGCCSWSLSKVVVVF